MSSDDATHDGGSAWLLVSDLDDTLLGDDGALERFRAYHDAAEGALRLVYASGRFCDSIQRSIEETRLPVPAATIGGVGAEIWRYPEQTPMTDWWERIGRNWSARRVREVLEDEPGLELQPDACQSAFKVSYFLGGADGGRLRRMREKLGEAGLEVEMIYSSDRDLDFLPGGVDKGAAACFVAGVLGFPPARVMSAGNSGNDASLMGHGFSGIVVGNAHADLKAVAGNPGARVYVAAAHHADGVREGIVHWSRRELPS